MVRAKVAEAIAKIKNGTLAFKVLNSEASILMKSIALANIDKFFPSSGNLGEQKGLVTLVGRRDSRCHRRKRRRQDNSDCESGGA